MSVLQTAGKAALKERGDDLYETPVVAVQALLRHERLPRVIWEPACGPGSIVKVCEPRVTKLSRPTWSTTTRISRITPGVTFCLNATHLMMCKRS
jgi:hypothetical protein